MRCTQCGFEAAAGATFCSRCGQRMITLRPEAKHEFALANIMPSWWLATGSFFSALVLAGLAALIFVHGRRGWPLAAALLVLAWIIVALAVLGRRSTSWSLTSERLIERRGFLSRTRREIELADIRSVEIDRRLIQRLFGLGSVVISSAASADFSIRMEGVADPETIAETVRRARLRRLA
ncbi:MAG TPA: PH domain-containing protein [Candidatus Binataceae bacterium]|nr:PH domain-containing protein [Candidatus Binataceae bacterium]